MGTRKRIHASVETAWKYGGLGVLWQQTHVLDGTAFSPLPGPIEQEPTGKFPG